MASSTREGQSKTKKRQKEIGKNKGEKKGIIIEGTIKIRTQVVALANFLASIETFAFDPKTTGGEEKKRQGFPFDNQ